MTKGIRIENCEDVVVDSCSFDGLSTDIEIEGSKNISLTNNRSDNSENHILAKNSTDLTIVGAQLKRLPDEIKHAIRQDFKTGADVESVVEKYSSKLKRYGVNLEEMLARLGRGADSVNKLIDLLNRLP